MGVRKPRVVGDTPVHQIIVDWDGTAVPPMWPERPTVFMPGFVESMNRLHAAGFKLVIASARLSPYDPWTSERRPQEIVDEEIAAMRALLDQHGLTFIDIWTKEGKPGGSVYIDDKAERYNGCNGCWRRLTDKILIRLGAEEAVFPAFNQEVAA